jgi:hypothetical protein
MMVFPKKVAQLGGKYQIFSLLGCFSEGGRDGCSVIFVDRHFYLLLLTGA